MTLVVLVVLVSGTPHRGTKGMILVVLVVLVSGTPHRGTKGMMLVVSAQRTKGMMLVVSARHRRTNGIVLVMLGLVVDIQTVGHLMTSSADPWR
ncbi:hypothetical protein BC827DRAFT_1180321 [Russula dissimulans]|nr:hypothetical protein BC827DRAFT_1180321 [Russula dissimulans]